jgi:hypothetical protein
MKPRRILPGDMISGVNIIWTENQKQLNAALEGVHKVAKGIYDRSACLVIAVIEQDHNIMTSDVLLVMHSELGLGWSWTKKGPADNIIFTGGRLP